MVPNLMAIFKNGPLRIQTDHRYQIPNRRQDFLRAMPSLIPEADDELAMKQRGAGGLDLRAPFPFPWYPPRGNSYGLPLSSAPCSMPLSPSIWNGFFRVGRSR